MTEEKKPFDKVSYNNDFNKKTYDRIHLLVSKGKKSTISAHAESRGESLNKFINRAISEQIRRDTEE